MNRDTLAKILAPLLPALARYLASQKTGPVSSYTPPSATQTPTPSPTQPRAVLDPTAPYNWSTPSAACHSTRVIADEMQLTPQQKDDMCRTINCESGFLTNIVMYNCEHGFVRREKYNPAIHGKIYSKDVGICQWNNDYHGHEISEYDAEFNPEKAIRLMCRYVKQGQINQWVCHSTRKYLSYAPRV